MSWVLPEPRVVLLDHPNDALSLDEAVCTLYRDGWLARIQERVSQLRPTAVCVERELLRRAGREDEMPGATVINASRMNDN